MLVNFCVVAHQFTISIFHVYVHVTEVTSISCVMFQDLVSLATPMIEPHHKCVSLIPNHPPQPLTAVILVLPQTANAVSPVQPTTL